MGNFEQYADTIQQLMEKMKAVGIDRVKIEEEGFKLTLERNAAQVSAGQVVVQPTAVAAASVSDAAEAAPCEEKPGTIVKSPIVGTFYRSPSPEKPAFTEIGKPVKKGDVLFIIESMKLMNEVQSECDGTVAEFLVENGAPVEYGQPILRIE